MADFDPLFTVQEPPDPASVSLASLEPIPVPEPVPMSEEQGRRFGACRKLAVECGIALSKGRITEDQNLGILQTMFDCIDGKRDVPASLEGVIAGREQV